MVTGPFTNGKNLKKNEPLKIDIGSESEDDFILKSPKKMSMSPKINIGPMIDSEKFHEKSRNSLWEAFMTSKDSKEKPKPSKSPSVSPREPVIPKIVKKDEEKREDTKDSSPTDSKYLL